MKYPCARLRTAHRKAVVCHPGRPRTACTASESTLSWLRLRFSGPHAGSTQFPMPGVSAPTIHISSPSASASPTGSDWRCTASSDAVSCSPVYPSSCSAPSASFLSFHPLSRNRSSIAGSGPRRHRSCRPSPGTADPWRPGHGQRSLGSGLITKRSEGVTEKRTVLSAAEPKQTANWDKRAKHGLFMQHLLDALYGKGDADGNGKVTVAEARRYLDDHMTHDHMTHDHMTPAAWLSRRSGQRASLLTRPDGVVLSSAPSGCFPGASGAGGVPGRGRVGGGRRRAGQKFGGARHVRARAGAGAGEEGSCGSSVLLRQARAARRSTIGGHGLLSGGGGVLSGPPRRGA